MRLFLLLACACSPAPFALVPDVPTDAGDASVAPSRAALFDSQSSDAGSDVTAIQEVEAGACFRLLASLSGTTYACDAGRHYCEGPPIYCCEPSEPCPARVP